MENGDQRAFPADAHTHTDGGLTKREYFAAMAMQGIMASLTEMQAIGSSTLHHAGMDENLAREAVSIADAVLKELDKPKSE